MSLLTPAHMSQSAAKIAVFGKPGSGKTLSAIMLLIGLAKRDGERRIAMLDTEGGSDFVKDVCDTEGIELLVARGRSFVDMRDALREAESSGCSGYLVDSVSEPWAELNEAIRERLNLRGRKLQFQHRDELYTLWKQWVREMLDSRLHCVLSGRLSNDWDDVADDAGDIEHVKVGTKMRGESDAGYEPHLLIELDALRDSLARDKRTRSKRGRMTHTLTILKDRFRILNGRSFQFPDVNRYAAGDYVKTYKALSEHFDRLAPRGTGLVRAAASGRSSAELFTPATGESQFAEAARRRTIALETIDATLTRFWPGQTGEDKRARSVMLECLFKSRSRTAIEGLAPEVLESGELALRHFETAALDPDQQINIRDEACVIALILSCRDLETARKEAMVV